METPSAAAVLVTVAGIAGSGTAFWFALSRERFAKWYGPIAERELWPVRTRRSAEVVPMLDPVGVEATVERSRRIALIMSATMLLFLGVAIVSWLLSLRS